MKKWSVKLALITKQKLLPVLAVCSVCWAADLYANEVGLTAGNFRVDESGAATYNLPFSLAPGRAGVQPQIGLNYSSNNGSEGIVGVGWSLTGLSAITRCPQLPVHDDGNIQAVEYSENDKFCLDGQRLQLIDDTDTYGAPGSQYYTEVDGFSVITAIGGDSSSGPDYFEVATKSGETHYYGDPTAVDQRYAGTDAYVEPSGYAQGSLARMWAVKIIEDISGNFIRYHYQEDSDLGTFYTDSIEYAGNIHESASGDGAPFAEVQFIYEDYNKGFIGYASGASLHHNQILKRVDSYHDSELYRSYHFTYENSQLIEERLLLTHVQECVDTSASSCYPATVFGWQRPPLDDYSPDESPIEKCGEFIGANVNELEACLGEAPEYNYDPFRDTSEFINDRPVNGNSLVLDFNGDGFADLITVKEGTWKVEFGAADGYGSSEVLYSVGDVDEDHIQTIDYDGDGVRDILVAEDGQSNWQVLTYKPGSISHNLCESVTSCYDHIVQRSFSVIDLGVVANGLEDASQIMDVDGDGLEDIVYSSSGNINAYINNGDGTFQSSHTLIEFESTASALLNNAPVSQTAQVSGSSSIDINGDGRSDLIAKITEDNSYCMFNGQPAYYVSSERECEADLLGTWHDVSTTNYQLLVSSGATDSPELAVHQDLGSATYQTSLRVADFNGDGLSDLMFLNSADEWYYRLSNGRELLPSVSSGLPATSDSLKGLTSFIDLNSDGRADVLSASSSSLWRVYFSHPIVSDPDTIYFERRGDKSFDSNAIIRFGDVNGDGRTDLLTGKSFNWTLHTDRAGEKDYVIDSITNGFGVETNIEYAPMTDTDVYVMQASDNDLNSETLSPVSGMQLVSRVSTDINEVDGITEQVSVSYEYGGLLIHRSGRGSLGFQMLRTVDEQTGVISETQYSQEYGDSSFATTAMPVYSRQILNDQLLSEATNELAVKATANGAIWPYIEKSTELSYVYGSDGTSALIGTTVSDFGYDGWGNLTSSTVTVTDEISQEQLTTETTNEYGTDEQKRLGRLLTAEVTKSRTGQSSITRKSEFTYYDDGLGLLKTTTVSPETNEVLDEEGSLIGAIKLTTTYTYDGYGNKTETSVSGSSTTNGSTQTRTSSVAYVSGRFVDYSENALGEKVYQSYNGDSATSFSGGNLTSLTTTDANGLATTTYYNAFGQATSKLLPNGQTQSTSQSYDVGDMGYNAYYKITESNPGAADSETYFDRWGRQVVKRVQGFDGNWVQSVVVYDDQGRQETVYEPDSTSDYTTYSYDELNRAYSIALPNGGTTSVSWSGRTTTETNTLTQQHIKVTNAFGETVSTIDEIGNVVSFTYDSYGNLLTSVTTNADGGSHTIEAKFDDWGRKYKTIDPIKGTWRYTYNAFGELYTQTTMRGHTFSFSYDELGRKIRSYEPDEGTLCWDYGSNSAEYNVGKLIASAKYTGNESCTSPGSSALISKEFSYNELGLLRNTETRIDGVSYLNSQTYDDFSRPDIVTYPAAGEVSVSIQNSYNATGYLEQIKDLGQDKVLKTIDAMNARMQLTQATYGNGMVLNNSYFSDTGWLDSSQMSSGSLNSAIYVTYDTQGNVESRQTYFAGDYGNSNDFTETYYYDSLNRLTGRTISLSPDGSALPSAFTDAQTYMYDAWGNFSYKSGAGYYDYADEDAVHRLSAVYSDAAKTDKLYDFAYDENGNITSDGNRQFTYGSFDKPISITTLDESATSHMHYGVDREMYQKVDCFGENGTLTEQTTTYLGAYEKVERVGGAGNLTEHKYHLGDIIITHRDNGTSDTVYLHKDHQGSLTALYNDNAEVITQAIYDPFGKRTEVYVDSLLADYTHLSVTERGYTGHKHIQALDIIHMKGRIYDATLGRFLQADPFIQFPDNSQSYNRYSYVLNNPMTFTDPSGYFIGGLFKKAIRSVIKHIPMDVGNFLISYGSKFCGPWAGACASVATYEFYRAHGVSRSGALRAAAIAGGLAYTFQQIGDYYSGLGDANLGDVVDFGTSMDGLHNFGGNWLTSGQIAGQIASHAAAGGIAAKLGGGKFGHGFFSGGVTKGLTGAFLPGGSEIKGSGELVKNTAISAAIGGTASVIAGGKFSNGARTAAYQYLYNQVTGAVINKAKGVLNNARAKKLAAQRVRAIDAELEMINKLSHSPDQLMELLESYGFEGDRSKARVATLSLQAQLMAEKSASMYVAVEGLSAFPNYGSGKYDFRGKLITSYVKVSPMSALDILSAWPLVYMMRSTPDYTANYSCSGASCYLDGIRIHE